MSRTIEIEISLPSLDRRFRLPVCGPGEASAAIEALDRWSARGVIAPAVTAQALQLLDAIAKVRG